MCVILTQPYFEVYDHPIQNIKIIYQTRCHLIILFLYYFILIRTYPFINQNDVVSIILLALHKNLSPTINPLGRAFPRPPTPPYLRRR